MYSLVSCLLRGMPGSKAQAQQGQLLFQLAPKCCSTAGCSQQCVMSSIVWLGWQGEREREVASYAANAAWMVGRAGCIACVLSLHPAAGCRVCGICVGCAVYWPVSASTTSAQTLPSAFWLPIGSDSSASSVLSLLSLCLCGLRLLVHHPS